MDSSGESSDEEQVFEQAAGWVARLTSSDATDADRKAFEGWRDADPARAAAYTELDALWRELGHLPDPRPSVRSTKPILGIALAALLAAATAYEYGLVDRWRADLWSGVGDIRRATLPDGSRVDLNTDTALALRFTDGIREVEMLRGEASFDVVPDASRPFVVRGGGLSIRAVGTRFFVRADGTDHPVGVAEGRVEVSAEDHRAVVSAGEAIRVGDAALQVTAADVDREMAWRDGRLVFAGEPLSAVLTELARYRRGRIVLLDRRLGERRVTGAFDARNTEDALDVIAATMGARVTRLPLLVLVGTPL